MIHRATKLDTMAIHSLAKALQSIPSSPIFPSKDYLDKKVGSPLVMQSFDICYLTVLFCKIQISGGEHVSKSYRELFLFFKGFLFFFFSLVNKVATA
jgi:hypothetical protein